MAATAIFALVYLDPRDTVDGTGTNIGNRLAHQVRLSADQSDVPAPSCRIGTGPAVAAAAALFAHKGLLIVGAIDGGEAVGRLHECLCGAHNGINVMRAGRFGVAQSLLSAILLFLLLLAIRNQFRLH